MIMDLLYILIGYVFGSIPTGYLIAKLNKVNIYEVGSGNPGSTNIGRVLGKKWGVIVFILDILKTILPIILILLIFKFNSESIDDIIKKYGTSVDMASFNKYYVSNQILYTGLGSVLGHIFPFTMKFKGGKGVACTFAVILMFSPIYGIVLFIIQKIIVKITKIVSIASISALLLLMISSIILSIFQFYPFDFINSIDMCIPISIMCIVCIIMHHDNIKRLLTNTENKI